PRGRMLRLPWLTATDTVRRGPPRPPGAPMRAIPRLASCLCVCLFAVVLAGCGDDGGLPITSKDLTSEEAMPDMVVADDLATFPDLVPSLGVGMPCPNGTECQMQMGMICLGPRLDPTLPADGYCSRQCKNDQDCGANAFCGPPLGSAGNLCWLRCGP